MRCKSRRSGPFGNGVKVKLIRRSRSHKKAINTSSKPDPIDPLPNEQSANDGNDPTKAAIILLSKLLFESLRFAFNTQL